MFGGGGFNAGFGGIQTTGGSLFGATTAQSATPVGGGGGLFGAATTTPSTFGSPTSGSNEPTSHGLNYVEKVERGVTHGKVVSFIGQLADHATTPFRYRCNDYLNPNGRPNAGAMLTNNIGGLFGQQAPAAQQPAQQSLGGLFGNTAAQPAATGGGLFGAAPAGGSLFGSTNTTGGGLFGASSPTQPTNTSLFGNPQQPAQSSFFGGAGGGLFGSTAQPAAPAANAAGGGLFGNTQQSTAGNLFGSQTSTLGAGGLFGQTNQTQPPAAGGLFGNSQPANTGLGGGSLFGNTTNTNTLGTLGQQPSTTTGGGLFGSTPAPATSTGTGLFGATASSGGGLFGAPQPQQSTGIGLFGQPNTTTTNTTGGLFGSTGGGLLGNNAQSTPQTTTSLFGSTTTTNAPSTGLFGQPAAAPSTTGLFGSTSTQQPSGGGLFGTSTTAAPAGGGLFGGGTTGGLGTGMTTSQPTTGLFGASSSPAPATGGLFGSTQNTTAGGGLFGGTTNTTTGGGLFGNSTLGASTTGGGLFGNNSNTGMTNTLGGGGLFGSGQTGTAAAGTGLGGAFGAGTGGGLFGANKPGATQAGASVFGLNSQPTNVGAVPAAVNAPLGTAMKDDPYNLSAIAITNAASMLYGSTNQVLPIQPFAALSGIRSKRKPTYLSAYLANRSDEPVSASNALLPNVTPSTKPSSALLQPLDPPKLEPQGRRKPSAQLSLFTPVDGAEPLIDGTLTNWSDAPRAPPLGEDVVAIAPAPVVRTPADPSLLPIFTRCDYTCRPSLEAMSAYTEEELSRVEDLTITREGYGSITWPGFTDVRRLNIDAAVELGVKSVEVYSDSWEAYAIEQGWPLPATPPVGQGLNKRAVITLYDCYASRKKPKRQQATEADRQRLADYTENVLKATFLSLSADYKWTFRVEHFSRYTYPDFEPGSAVRKPAKRRQARRASLVLRDQLKKSMANARSAERESKRKHDLLTAIQYQSRPSGRDRRLQAEDLWGIVEASRSAPTGEIDAYTCTGAAFEVALLTDVLKHACRPIDPGAVGSCLHSISLRRSDPAEKRLLNLVASLWRSELDVLDGVIRCLLEHNKQFSESIIDLLLADDAKTAALRCIKDLQKPRLSIIIAASACPGLSAQPRIAEQLIAYRKQQLEVHDAEVAQILSLISGVLSVDGEPIIFKSWTQALAAILIFEMNTSLLRANLPTFEDQLRVIRCALDRLLSIYPSGAWNSDPEWLLLCFLAHRCLTQDTSAGPEHNMSTELTSMPEPMEMVKTCAQNFEQDEHPVSAVCRWLVLLYGSFNEDPDLKLVEALQQTAPWIPANIARGNSDLVWSLIEYQTTRNKSFLTAQIFAEYSQAFPDRRTNDACSSKARLHSSRVPRPEGPIPKDDPSATGALMDGSLLPLWFVYLCVAEELSRRKLTLQAASAYFSAYRAGLTGPTEVQDPEGWWAVLKESAKLPDEGQFMTLILQALVSEKYLSQLHTMIVEALRPAESTRRQPDLLDIRLLDMLVDLRLVQLVEALQSYKAVLDIAKLGDLELNKSDQHFLTLWNENNMDAIYDLLEGASCFVEVVLSRNAATAPSFVPAEHNLSTRALENIRQGCGMGLQEFEVEKYLASLF